VRRRDKLLRSFAATVVAILAGRTLAPLPVDGFQGTPEAGPTLTAVVWQWVVFESADGTTTAPDDPARSTAQFLEDSSLLARVDCNSG
jgi:hypothetical protein